MTLALVEAERNTKTVVEEKSKLQIYAFKFCGGLNG